MTIARQSPPYLHSWGPAYLQTSDTKPNQTKPRIPANLGPWGVAVLDEGLDADLDLGLDGGLGVLDEATLLVVLVALLLLLSRVGRCVGSVAPTVVRVVAQHLVGKEDQGQGQGSGSRIRIRMRRCRTSPPRRTRSPPPSPPCQCISCLRRQRWRNLRQHHCRPDGLPSKATKCRRS